MYQNGIVIQLWLAVPAEASGRSPRRDESEVLSSCLTQWSARPARVQNRGVTIAIEKTKNE